jgi:hypothetical protein
MGRRNAPIVAQSHDGDLDLTELINITAAFEKAVAELDLNAELVRKTIRAQAEYANAQTDAIMIAATTALQAQADGADRATAFSAILSALS